MCQGKARNSAILSAFSCHSCQSDANGFCRTGRRGSSLRSLRPPEKLPSSDNKKLTAGGAEDAGQGLAHALCALCAPCG